jgi:peptidoglycan/xylan/chitin deacetylase (PgdA/CDA1 family)
LFHHRSISQFNKDIEFLLKYFEPISLQNLIEIIHQKKNPKRDVFHLTFDDGYKEIFDVVAPILKNKRLPATFFITKNFVDNLTMGPRHKASILIDKILSCQQNGKFPKRLALHFEDIGILPKNLKKNIFFISAKNASTLKRIAEVINVDFGHYLEMEKPFVSSENLKNLVKNGFTLGGHGIDHKHFSGLSLDQQIDQTNESINFLDYNFGIDCKTFAFPYSDYGVSNKFLKKMQNDVDLFFGTSAFMIEDSRNIYHRFSGENGRYNLKNSLSYLLAQRILRSFIGKHRIVRQ